MWLLGLYHYGKKDSNGNYLTIKSVNNNLDYVQDNSAVALFGVIEKTVIFEDVTLASNLLAKGNAYLNETINKTVSIELNASDLHNLDVNIESFRIGDNVKVISTPHGLNRYFLLSKLHLTLDNIASCSMTLGATFKSFTQKQVDSEKKIDSVSENMITTNQDVSRIDSEVQEINTFIEAVPTDYLSIEDFNDFKDELAQKLTGVHIEKGSVTDVEDLEDVEEPILGDIYKVIDENNNTYTRYIYNGNDWEELLDLSNS